MTKVFHSPSAQQSYFNKAVEIQLHAFKSDWADKKFAQSCESLCTSGWCNTCADCNKCALKWAHDKTIRDLNNPDEVSRRYKAWKSENNKQPSPENRSWKTKDRNGHETEVIHY